MQKMADNLTRIAAIGACLILVVMVLFILYEIVLRTFFDASTYVLDEFIGYGVATMTFLSLAAALNGNSLIRVNLVLTLLESKSRRVLEVASHLIGAALFGFVATYFYKFVMRDFERGTVSNSVAQVPLWIPQAIMLAGIIILIIQFLVLAISIARGAHIADIQEEL